MKEKMAIISKRMFIFHYAIDLRSTRLENRRKKNVVCTYVWI